MADGDSGDPDRARDTELSAAPSRWFVLVVVGICAVPMLLAAPVPLRFQPIPDARDYVTAASDLFGADVRYPPGWPLVIAVLGSVLAPKTAALTLYFLVVALAARLAGRWGAVAAAVLCLGSPFLVASSTYVMSDAAGAATAVCAVLLVLSGRPAAAGLLAGFGALVRVAAAGWIVGLVFVVRSQAFRLLAIMGILAMAAWQVAHPYPADQSEFALRYLWEVPPVGDNRWYIGGFPELLPSSPPGVPNSLVYALTLTWYWVFTLPLVGLVGLVEVWRRRREPAGRMATAVILGNVALFLPYYFQTPRFLAPAGMVLVAFTAAGAARLIERVRGRTAPARPAPP